MAGARILVVEDNHDNLRLMKLMLAALGHEPILATSGEEGIEAGIRERPDLILMDLQMPHMDGFETAHRMRQEPELETTPIVAVTALAMAGDREDVLRAGFDSYVDKPINIETFWEALDAALPEDKRTGPIVLPANGTAA